MARAWISLGSNIEPRREYLARALGRLNQGPTRVAALSHLFESAAVDVVDQADFLNLAAELETRLGPEELLERLKEIEAEAGKKVERRRGPRTLDLDLLMLDGQVRDTASLRLPHPRMALRAFVLEPLAQIAPEARHPLSGKTVLEMRHALEPGQVLRDLGPFE